MRVNTIENSCTYPQGLPALCFWLSGSGYQTAVSMALASSNTDLVTVDLVMAP